MLAYWIGYGLDLAVGDPVSVPHPIRYIGRLVRFWEHKLLREGDSPGSLKLRGVVLVLLTVVPVYLFYLVLVTLAARLHPIAGLIVQALVFFQMMATRSLCDEGMKLYHALGAEPEGLAGAEQEGMAGAGQEGKTGAEPEAKVDAASQQNPGSKSLSDQDIDNALDPARKQLSMLVSRDTSKLDRVAIIKGGVETVSENFADGILAPLFFTAIGGVPLGMAYKAVNTLDSMVGYKNDKYLHFGWAAAKFDDLATWLPARLSGLFVILAAWVLRLDWKRAARIMIRDRRNHESPNSPYPEASVAGALGIQLGGRATYFGVTYEKKTMGDPVERPVRAHLKTTVRLVYGASILAFLFWQGVIRLVL
ncbi:adenosylcobinamide-phosphate synthase CbiB [Acidaminobacter sp.]|uniref:adenosylcobinamide-phosphate synthase CbiB n=1 Tax=Acidaminobacter sp. TaxID=1872102 RepID=UPI0013812D62|nr:adenosylcobinamide-phosphate synthase CbiB [Acidaminobacter sp.]MDK9711956.1 adenosylcobinamide-phosphate synthase CbiB [Acidaminobacter sp.]MZQ97654.1 cobalamin biosynthesis protein CobD [Acidaminobacter sp.]